MGPLNLKEYFLKSKHWALIHYINQKKKKVYIDKKLWKDTQDTHVTAE